MKAAIVVSRFNKAITDNLLYGAKRALQNSGFNENDIEVFFVPGAFEIPLTVKKLISTKEYAGVAALGCLIKGETAHFEYICNPVSNELMRISCDSGIPVTFGVLTCYTAEQAYERSLIDPLSSETNKGYECGQTLAEMISLLKDI